MLYILPPPSVPTPPSPWSSIVCGKFVVRRNSNNNNTSSSDVNSGEREVVVDEINKRINYVLPSPRRSRYRALFRFKNDRFVVSIFFYTSFVWIFFF